jgi:hypothetical protein
VKIAADVELLKRYSKNSYQGSRLRRLVEVAERSAKLPVREVLPLPHTHRIDRRLPAETITELVHAYRNGASTPELERRYEIGGSSDLVGVWCDRTRACR